MELLNYFQKLIFHQKFATPLKVPPGAPLLHHCLLVLLILASITFYVFRVFEVCLAISFAMSSNGVALLACLSSFASDALCLKNSEHFLPASQVLAMSNWGNVFIEAVTGSAASLKPIYGQNKFVLFQTPPTSKNKSKYHLHHIMRKNYHKECDALPTVWFEKLLKLRLSSM